MRKLATVPLLLLFALDVNAQQTGPRPTGHSFIGLPAVNFDADEGFGYGAQLQYYDYGDKGVQPYRFSIQPTVFLTTRGRRDLTLFVDAPHFLPGGWRAGAQLAREKQITAPYYGLGNNTVNLESATKSPARRRRDGLAHGFPLASGVGLRIPNHAADG